jgi:RNA polymerase sigma factor (sigma-70 family)
VGKGRRWSQREDEARREEGRAADARLVEGLRRRTPEALAGLHEQYAAGIYNLALRVVRHVPDAEDITQDVLIRAFERLPRDREVVLRPWLYRLTLNRCYDHLRWSSRRRFAAPEQETASPDDPYEQSELQALLEASLADLTRRQRAALLLKDVHGLSLVEVGACLDLTPGSVEVLLARARKAFRACYQARCTAAGRHVPGSAGALAALPLLPLPLGLSAPPLALTAAPAALLPVVPLAPLAGGPLTAAGGGGIAALLGLPPSIKTAVLVAAAAASLGSGEFVATRTDQRPPRPPAGAAAAVRPDPVRTSGGEPTIGYVATVPAKASAAPPASRATPPPAASHTPSPAPSEASPSPAASVSAEPSPHDDPLGIAAPLPSASPSATLDASPSATVSPDPHATTPPPSPTTSPSTSPSLLPEDGSPSPPPPPVL